MQEREEGSEQGDEKADAGRKNPVELVEQQTESNDLGCH